MAAQAKMLTRYSKNEAKVLGILRAAGKPISTVDVANKVYATKTKRPMNARQTILGALISLQRKAKANKETFAIKNTERKGPHPIQFWIEGK